MKMIFDLNEYSFEDYSEKENIIIYLNDNCKNYLELDNDKLILYVDDLFDKDVKVRYLRLKGMEDDILRIENTLLPYKKDFIKIA